MVRLIDRGGGHLTFNMCRKARQERHTVLAGFWREEDTHDFGGSTMTFDLGIVGPRRRAALPVRRLRACCCPFCGSAAL